MTDSTLPSPTPNTASLPAPSGPALAGAIGAALAAPVSQMAQLLNGMRMRQALSDEDLLALDDAIEQAHRIAVRSQQVARLAAGRLRQSHEKLDLHALLHDVLLEHQATFAARGIEMRQHLRPVEIVVDPGLLVSLLQAAVGWAAEQGTRLQVKLGMKSWPENGLLVIKVSRPAQPAGGSAAGQETDTLQWFLLTHIALAMGVLVSREIDADDVTAFLEFPRTVRNLSGLATPVPASSHDGGDTVVAGTAS